MTDTCKAAEIFLKEKKIQFETGRRLSQDSTFRIGGEAAVAAFPDDTDQLCSAIGFFRANGVYFTVIGKGSNVLFADEGFDGVVIFTSKLNRISADGNILTAECGVPVTYLSSAAQKKSLSGLEFAYGIPGTVGGAVFMNAGAYGGEMKDVISKVSFFDPETGVTGTISADECRFGYRESSFQHSEKVILSASFSLHPRDSGLIKADMDDYMSRRREKQPLEFPSAGSTFRRYPGYFTAKLIDDAGLKGFSVGGAQVSEKHAGFVINRGNATAADVLALVDEIKKRIFEINGINIECEIRYIPYSVN
mgnify:FL=1